MVKQRLPEGVWPIHSLSGIRVNPRIKDDNTAAMTYYNTGGDRFRLSKEAIHLKQRITFYSHYLDRLPDKAVVAIMAHEISHAWLNDHIGPEQSDRREKQVDRLVLKWGFRPEVDNLNQEAVSV
jgi:hypothetical protein